MTRKINRSKKYITEDGYVFKLEKDGTLTDGDMTFNSLEDLKKVVDVKLYRGSKIKTSKIFKIRYRDTMTTYLLDGSFESADEAETYIDIYLFGSSTYEVEEMEKQTDLK